MRELNESTESPVVMVTGANGFVGRRVCQLLLDAGCTVRQAVRKPRPGAHRDDRANELVVVGDIGPETEWRQALRSVQLVVHLAALAHCLETPRHGAFEHYLRVNALAVERLAQEAAAAGVRRLVFLSSVKVNGERTLPREQGGVGQFSEILPPRPEGPYALAKWEAEKRLWALAAATGMEIVVVRSPLVYGPGAKANLWRLLRLVDSGLPLPFGSVRNGRSLVFLDNLVDFILCCLFHPAAAGQTFLVSDGGEISTPELIRQIATALGRPSRLWPCPEVLLRLAGWLFGRSSEVERLIGSLRIDSSKAREILGWQPPFPVEVGIRETVAWFLRGHNGRV